jgi:hypothetical protein
MNFTTEQIERLIQLGGRIADIAMEVPAPPAGLTRFNWADELRPAIASNDAILTEMLALLQSGVAPSSDVLDQIAKETVVSPEPQQPSTMEKWASTFNAMPPKIAPEVPDNIRFPRIMPNGEFQR